MAGDAPDSTDPIALARQVIEDAIRLGRAELAVVGAELKRAIIQLLIASALILVAANGAALAMLGPGAWSIDARLSGRRRLIRER